MDAIDSAHSPEATFKKKLISNESNKFTERTDITSKEVFIIEGAVKATQTKKKAKENELNQLRNALEQTNLAT